MLVVQLLKMLLPKLICNHEVVENASPNENSKLAGQADLLPPTHADVVHHDPTEEVDEILNHPTEDEQADEECTTTNTESRIAELNVNAKPWYHVGDVQDVFCRDQEYLQHLHQPQAPPNQCKV